MKKTTIVKGASETEGTVGTMPSPQLSETSSKFPKSKDNSEGIPIGEGSPKDGERTSISMYIQNALSLLQVPGLSPEPLSLKEINAMPSTIPKNLKLSVIEKHMVFEIRANQLGDKNPTPPPPPVNCVNIEEDSSSDSGNLVEGRDYSVKL